MIHKHHIIPRHAGGTDDPSNIAELTVEEHAEAHRILYEQYGRWQDEVAWRMLSGQINKAEAIRLSQVNGDKAGKSLGGKIGGSRKKPPITEATRKKLSERKNFEGKHHSEEAKEKIRAGNMGRKHTPEAIEKIRQASLRRHRAVARSVD
jgi:hypothetical protein